MDVPDILQDLLADGVIDDVRARLMSGKEASVFVVERRGELLAAKVYKEREQRTFKATASYTEGRNQTRNSRDKRAMGKRTSYGKELVEASWRDMEYAALHAAYSAGVRVPEPILLYENVLLMELLVDEAGAPAPRLADFALPSEVAALLHREIYGQVRLLLRAGKIHGDLSAYNILIARGGPTFIDLPQVVDASTNNSAPEILRRDLANVTEHLARFDSRLLLFRDCGSALWQHYMRGHIDSATEPEEGGLRRTSNRGHKGRRARDAERGRAGRERSDRPHGAPDRGHHAPPPQSAEPHHPRREQRPDPRPAQRPANGPDQRRGPPPDHQRNPRPDQHREPRRDQPREPRRDQPREPRPDQPPNQRRDQPRDQRPEKRQDQRRGPPPPRDPQRGPSPRDEKHRGPPPPDRRPPPIVERRGPSSEGGPSRWPPRDRPGRD